MESFVFERSINLIMKAAYLYYTRGLSQRTIAEMLGISVPTVSRLLKQARTRGIVQFSIGDTYRSCIELESILCCRFGLKEVIIAPIDPKEKCSEEEKKRSVAIEGARYLQRKIAGNDVLGVGFGSTVHSLIYYLNPCLRVGAQVVTLIGEQGGIRPDLTSHSLTTRLALTFGGNQHCLEENVIQKSEKRLHQLLADGKVKDVTQYFNKLTISLSGIGTLLQNNRAVFPEYLQPGELQRIQKMEACSMLLMHFLKKNGEECHTSLSDHTLSIGLQDYKRTPCKIVVAAENWKAEAVLAAVRGGLVDVLVIDQQLAERLEMMP